MSDDQVFITPFGVQTVPGKTWTPLGLLTGRRRRRAFIDTYLIDGRLRTAFFGQWAIEGNRLEAEAILPYNVNGHTGPRSDFGKPPGAWEGQGSVQGGSPWKTRRGFR